jgi:hypothetical protein
LPPGGKTFNEFAAVVVEMANCITPKTSIIIRAKLRIWFKASAVVIYFPNTKALCLANRFNQILR